MPLPEMMMPDDEHPTPHAGQPSARALGFHALRMTLMSLRQQMESALALLSALEAGGTSASEPARPVTGTPERGTLAEQAANVFGRARAKQSRPPGEPTE